MIINSMPIKFNHPSSAGNKNKNNIALAPGRVPAPRLAAPLLTTAMVLQLFDHRLRCVRACCADLRGSGRCGLCGQGFCGSWKDFVEEQAIQAQGA